LRHHLDRALNHARRVPLIDARLDSYPGDLSALPHSETTARWSETTARWSQAPGVNRVVFEARYNFLYVFEARYNFLYVFEGDWLADPDLTAQARNNSVENFRLVFDRSFVDTLAKRVMDNEDIARRFFYDEEFKQVLIDWYAEKVYRQARSEG